MEIVAADIGGTHARFAIAEIEDGRVVTIGEPAIHRVAEHASFADAWRAFGETFGRALPAAAAIAIAAPVDGERIAFTNNPWVIHSASLPDALGVTRLTLVNDFAAVAHAVAHLDDAAFVYVCGPDTPIPDRGSITICGPGTGLGVAQLHRRSGGYDVIGCEGGHVAFAPLDSVEEAIVRRLRGAALDRVSNERILSGPGLLAIYRALAEVGESSAAISDDRTLWDMALAGKDPLATSALARFCQCLGAVAGDLALAHGPTGVVIAGGLGLRLEDHLRQSGFGARFVAKGRFEALMASIPVKLLTYPQPGLYGAAAAFAQEHAQ